MAATLRSAAPPEAIDKFVDSSNLRHHDAAKLTSKFLIFIALGQQFGERSYCHQWILDFVCNSGGKGTALSYPFRPTALLLKQSNALVKFGILYGNCDVAGESRKQVDVLSVVRIARQFWCKHENREQL